MNETRQLPRELYRTIAIDPDLQRQVRVAAALSGETVKDFAEKALRDRIQTLPASIAATLQKQETADVSR